MTAFKRRLHQFKENIWVDIAIVALALASAGLLVLELSVSLSPHQLTYPVTTVGRLIGMIFMFFGMGLVGTVAGIVSSHLMNRKKREHR